MAQSLVDTYKVILKVVFILVFEYFVVFLNQLS